MTVLKKLSLDILSAIDHNTTFGIFDNYGIIIYINDAFCKLSKYEQEDLRGKDHRFLYSDDQSNKTIEELRKIVQKGNIWKGDVKNKAKDGSFYWVHTTVVPIFDENDNLYQYIAIRTDITNRIQTEETLKKTLTKLSNSNKELSDIKHALDESSILAITNQKGAITFVNDKFCEVSKYNREELLGQDHRILNSGHQSKEFFQNLWKTIGEGNVWKGEIKNKAKDGSFYWVHTTIVPFLNEDGKPYQFVAIRNDITDQKRAEESLIKSEKLSAIGELAAGVAHEIRNPLTILKGFTEFLNAEEKEDKKKEYFKLLLDEIERINFIVGEFMLLAKPQSITLKTKPLIPIITSVIKFLQSEMNLHNVFTTLDFGSQDIYIECDENQIKQVFLNIIKNAIEAMPTGGTIEIKLARKSDKIHIIFIDAGMGIPQEKLSKIGQPFFTTKESGNGLGMMVSFKIIQNHKGNINIDSTEGVGTTFTIVLPCSTL